METWNERLAQAIAASDYKPHQLAQALNIKTPSLSAWIGAGTIQPAKNLTGENLIRVCQLLNIRPEWLMFREGPMRPAKSTTISTEMAAIISELEILDAKGGNEREDALYFLNRLLKRESTVMAKQA
jgi:hypothetical protein